MFRRFIAAAALFALACTAPQQAQRPVLKSAIYKGSGGGADSGSTRQTYIAAGLTATGLSSDYAYFWDDFEFAGVNTRWLQTGAGSGAVTGPTINGLGGGMIRMSTGATGSSHASEDANTAMISVVTTKAWYMAARLRVNTTPDANTILGVGLRDAAVAVTYVAGFHGALDATHFGVQYNGNLGGSSFSLVTAPDTAFHVLELWCAGDSKLQARLDGGSVLGLVTMTSVPSDAMYPFLTVRNGATAANQQIDVDWVVGIFQRI